MTVGDRPLTSRISAVWIYVRDVERSLAFYRDLLGLPLEADRHDPHWAEATLANGIRFAVHRAHPGAEPQPGTTTVDFAVEDVDAAAERLRAGGVRVGEVLREEWGSTVTAYDPDGYRVSLYQGPKA